MSLASELSSFESSLSFVTLSCTDGPELELRVERFCSSKSRILRYAQMVFACCSPMHSFDCLMR